MTIDENKIPNVSSLHSDTNIREIEKKVTDQNYDKYITTAEFTKFTGQVFDTRLAQVN